MFFPVQVDLLVVVVVVVVVPATCPLPPAFVMASIFANDPSNSRLLPPSMDLQTMPPVYNFTCEEASTLMEHPGVLLTEPTKHCVFSATSSTMLR